MDTKQELERVTEIVCRIGGLPAIAPDENFYRAGLASLRALELLVELETEYDVTIDDEQFMQAQTPRDLAAMLAGRSAVAAA